MNAGKYIFRFVVAMTAFFIGYSAYAGVRYVLSYFEPAKLKCNASVVPLAVPLTDTTEPEIEIEYTLSGDYYLFDEALNKGFPDLDLINIETEDEDGYTIPPRGLVRTKRDHKFISVSITDDLVSFETETVRGISYRFNGKFEPPIDDYDLGPVLRGSLIKLEKGKVVATLNSTFYPAGC